MISKILKEFEQKEQEKELRRNEEKVWFKKINDDNVKPIYKPFRFYESKEIDLFQKEREKLKKSNEEFHRQLTCVKDVRINFGKQYRKNSVEEYIDGTLFNFEMVSAYPTTLQNCYIRDKGFIEKDFSKQQEKFLPKEDNWMNNFYFQKFAYEFMFGDIFKYSQDGGDIPLIKNLKNFVIEVKYENMMNYLKDFVDRKFNDDDEVLSEKLIEDWKKNFNKIDRLKDLVKDINKVKFISNESFLVSLIEDDSEADVSISNQNPSTNRRNLNTEDWEKSARQASMRRMKIEDFELLDPLSLAAKFKEHVRGVFYRNISSIKHILKQVSVIKEETRVFSTFKSLVISMLFWYTLDFDHVTKEIVIKDDDDEDLKNGVRLLKKYFKVSTKDHFKLFSFNKIISDKSKIGSEFINCTFMIDRDFYKLVLDYVKTDPEFKNIFTASRLDDLEMIIKERLKRDFQNLELNETYENEIDKLTIQDDFQRTITMFTLEGELYKLVANFFNESETVQTNLLLFVLLLYYALYKKEKSSYDVYLYRVLIINEEQFLSFKKMRRNDQLYNQQFLLMSSNVSEAVKYFVDEKEISLGLKKEEFKSTHTSVNNDIDNPENNDNIDTYADNQYTTNNFLTTKDDEEEEVKEHDYKIMFEVEVRKDKSFLSPIVCDLKEYSAFPFEEEFLLSPNNVFTVSDILKLDTSGRLILVKLKLNPTYHKENFTTGIFKAKRKGKSLCKNIIFDSAKFHEESIEAEIQMKKHTTDFKIEEEKENIEDIILPDKDKYKTDKIDLHSVIKILDYQYNLQEVTIKYINSLLKIESDENSNVDNLKTFLEKTPNITKLDLSSNNLTHKNLDIIGDSFGNLSKLKTLILKKNSINLLTNFTQKLEEFELKLLDIDLSFNRLDVVGVRDLTSLMQHTSLQRINLSYNKIGSEGAKLISEKLKETPNLQYLDFSNNNLFSQDYDFEKMLSKNFFNVRKLNTLLLQGCNLTSQSIRILSENIKELVNLENINLSCNRIDQHDYDGSTSFSRNFEHLKKLKYLDLGYNYIGYLGIGGLKAMFFNFKKLYSLQRFMLNANSFDSSYALLDNLKYLENLIELNMNEMKIGDEGLKELSKTFRHLKNLELLHLNNNNITAEGIKNMIEFAKLEKLKELNLSNNKLKADGCRDLKFNKSLEVLNLWANDIRVDGVRNILSNIRPEFNLRDISFSQNNIDDKEKNGKADGLIFILKQVCKDLLKIKSINFSANYLNQSSFYHLIYYYPMIRERRLRLNICDCPSHSDLNNGVKGEFEKLSKDDGLVKLSL